MLIPDIHSCVLWNRHTLHLRKHSSFLYQMDDSALPGVLLQYHAMLEKLNACCLPIMLV